MFAPHYFISRFFTSLLAVPAAWTGRSFILLPLLLKSLYVGIASLQKKTPLSGLTAHFSDSIQLI